MHLSLKQAFAVLPLLAASIPSVAASTTADIYYYVEGGCGGNAYGSDSFVAYSGCVNIGQGAWSMGLHRQHVGDEGVSCTVFASSDCSGNGQSMGIGRSQDVCAILASCFASLHMRFCLDRRKESDFDIVGLYEYQCGMVALDAVLSRAEQLGVPRGVCQEHCCEKLVLRQ